MKHSTIFGIFSLFVDLGSISVFSAAASEPTHKEPATTEEMARKVKDLKNGLLASEDFAQARKILQAAGRSQDQSYAGDLKDIATIRSREDWHKLAFDALYSLWLLGEPKTYFLDNAKAFDNNPILAYYSILILSYNPSDEVGGSLPSRVSSKLGANVPLSPEAAELNRSINLVNGALSLFRMVNQMAKTYDATSEPEKKLALLVPNIRVAWSPMAVESHEPTTGLDPRAVWARQQLFRLSEDQPNAVAAGILALRADIVRQDTVIKASDATNKAYQEYFLRSVGAKAKVRFEELPKSKEANLR
jgi:hypothetical protein